MKEGKGIHQRTYMHDPWTWTRYGDFLKEGREAEWRWAKGEKAGTTVIV